MSSTGAYPRRPSRHIVRAWVIAGARTLLLSVLIIIALSPIATRKIDEAQAITAISILLVLWGVIFAIVLIWQLRRIRKAEYPLAAMIEALMVVFVLFLAIFAKIYYLVSMSQPEAFTEQLDYFTSYYFAMTVFSTVGFGDITPVQTLPRALAMLQMFLNLVMLGVTVRVIARAATQAKEPGSPSAPMDIVGAPTGLPADAIAESTPE